MDSGLYEISWTIPFNTSASSGQTGPTQIYFFPELNGTTPIGALNASQGTLYPPSFFSAGFTNVVTLSGTVLYHFSTESAISGQAYTGDGVTPFDISQGNFSIEEILSDSCTN